jgi:transposase-like protein
LDCGLDLWAAVYVVVDRRGTVVSAYLRGSLVVDENDVKVAGQRRYVDRAIDQFGQVIDVLVS